MYKNDIKHLKVPCKEATRNKYEKYLQGTHPTVHDGEGGGANMHSTQKVYQHHEKITSQVFDKQFK